jgi:hypothetical protein
MVLVEFGPIAIERLVREPVEPGPDRAEAPQVDEVDAAGAVRPVVDEARLLQQLQVLRDGRPADRQPRGERADRLRAIVQFFEDPPAGRVGDRREGNCVSHDLP